MKFKIVFGKIPERFSSVISTFLLREKEKKKQVKLLFYKDIITDS